MAGAWQREFSLPCKHGRDLLLEIAATWDRVSKFRGLREKEHESTELQLAQFLVPNRGTVRRVAVPPHRLSP